MSLLSKLLNLADEIDPSSLDAEFASLLVDGEEPKQAYALRRDLIVFTNRRLVLVDRQGIAGKKTSYESIPYRAITRFAKESKGGFDLDAELKIWTSGASEPIVRRFKADASIHRVYLLLSVYVLGPGG